MIFVVSPPSARMPLLLLSHLLQVGSVNLRTGEGMISVECHRSSFPPLEEPSSALYSTKLFSSPCYFVKPTFYFPLWSWSTYSTLEDPIIHPSQQPLWFPWSRCPFSVSSYRFSWAGSPFSLLPCKTVTNVRKGPRKLLAKGLHKLFCLLCCCCFYCICGCFSDRFRKVIPWSGHHDGSSSSLNSGRLHEHKKKNPAASDQWSI